MNFQTATQVEKLLYSYLETARVLGISERSVFTLVKLNELAAVKIGRRVMVPRTEIDAFIERKKNTGITRSKVI